MYDVCEPGCLLSWCRYSVVIERDNPNSVELILGSAAL